MIPEQTTPLALSLMLSKRVFIFMSMDRSSLAGKFPCNSFGNDSFFAPISLYTSLFLIGNLDLLHCRCLNDGENFALCAVLQFAEINRGLNNIMLTFVSYICVKFFYSPHLSIY